MGGKYQSKQQVQFQILYKQGCQTENANPRRSRIKTFTKRLMVCFISALQGLISAGKQKKKNSCSHEVTLNETKNYGYWSPDR